MGDLGSFVAEPDVVAAARATAALWINTYTDDVGRQRSATLPPVRKYGINLAVGENGIITPDPENEYPAMSFSCPGLYGEPERHGNGTYEATFALGVGCVVADTSKDAALTGAGWYGAAVAELFTQQGSLGGFAVETTWLDRETVPIGYELDRFVVASTNMFVVRVGGVLHRFTGPRTPPVDPTVAPAGEPLVASTGVTVHPLA